MSSQPKDIEEWLNHTAPDKPKRKPNRVAMCWVKFVTLLETFVYWFSVLIIVLEIVFNLMCMISPESGKVVYSQMLVSGLTLRYRSNTSMTLFSMITAAFIIQLHISLTDPSLWLNIISSFMLALHLYKYYIIVFQNYKRGEMEDVANATFVSDINVKWVPWNIHVLLVVLLDVSVHTLFHTGLLISFLVGMFHSDDGAQLYMILLNLVLFVLYTIGIYDITTTETDAFPMAIVISGIVVSFYLSVSKYVWNACSSRKRNRRH